MRIRIYWFLHNVATTFDIARSSPVFCYKFLKVELLQDTLLLFLQ